MLPLQDQYALNPGQRPLQYSKEGIQHLDAAQAHGIIAAVCGQVFGILSDMGAERGISNVSEMQLIMGRGENKFAVGYGMRDPYALFMPEHLHIIFNSIQNGVNKIPTMKNFLAKVTRVSGALPRHQIATAIVRCHVYAWSPARTSAHCIQRHKY